jgi:uncharacterized protein
MERYKTDSTPEEYARSPGCYVETNTGANFRVDTPVFDIDVISHSLSNICRYNGHVRQFYSVAEHSVIVALLMQELKLGDPKEGLLHDGVEAYLTDVASPWKPLFPDWRKVDKHLEVEFRQQFSLPGVAKTEGCNQADWLALFIEAWYLMPSRGEGYSDPTGIRPKALQLVDQGWRPACLLPPEALKAFNKMWERVK